MKNYPATLRATKDCFLVFFSTRGTALSQKAEKKIANANAKVFSSTPESVTRAINDVAKLVSVRKPGTAKAISKMSRKLSV